MDFGFRILDFGFVEVLRFCLSIQRFDFGLSIHVAVILILVLIEI